MNLLLVLAAVHAGSIALQRAPAPRARVDIAAYCNGADALDDTACIAKWIAAGAASGAELYASKGTYLYRKGATLASNTRLTCDKGGAATFRNNGGTGLFLRAQAAVQHVALRDCAFDMNGATTDFLVVILVSASAQRSVDIEVAGNRFYDQRILGHMSKEQRQYVVLLGCDSCRAIGNHLSEGGRIKIGRPGSDIVIRGNTIENTNDNAITVVDNDRSSGTSERIEIVGNTIVSPKGSGIFFGADGEKQESKTLTTSHVTVTDNLILGTWGVSCITAMLPAIASDIRVTGNTCLKRGEVPNSAGILIRRSRGGEIAAHGIVVENNVIGSDTSAGAEAGQLPLGGIFLGGLLDSVRVVGNRITSIGPRGIQVQRSARIDHATITGNTLTGGLLAIAGKVSGVTAPNVLQARLRQ